MEKIYPDNFDLRMGSDKRAMAFQELEGLWIPLG